MNVTIVNTEDIQLLGSCECADCAVRGFQAALKNFTFDTLYQCTMYYHISVSLPASALHTNTDR